MIGPQPASDEAVSRWLAERHRSIVNDLADTLDLDAGFREIAIVADHRALASDLSTILNLDSGLTAILPAPDGVLDPPTPESTSGQPSLTTSPTALVDAIAASPATTRLSLRTQVLALAQVIDVIPALDRANLILDILISDLPRARALIRTNARVRALADTIGRVHSDSRDLDVDLTNDLGHAEELARTLARVHDVDLAQDLAHVLARAHARACTLIQGLTHALAHDLGITKRENNQIMLLDAQRLRDVVNNLIGADLHNVDLRDVRLDGVRWSDTTR